MITTINSTMMQRFRKLAFITMSCLVFALQANAQLSNIPVTGFVNDIVANGVGATNTATTGTLPGVTYPSMGIDANVPAAYSFIDATYKWYSASTLPTCYLPTGGAIPSALTPGLTYQLQSYSANNALTVASNTFTGSVHPTTGSLSLVTPASYGKLYVLYESVLNTVGPTITATITFTDATTQVISGITVNNWFTATGVAYTPSISRAPSTAPGAPGACSTGPYLFEMPLSISAANLGKLVASVSFAWSSPTGTTQQSVDYFHALALGGIAPCTVPADQPTALTLTSPSGTVITGSFTPATSAPSGYLAVGYLTGSTPTAPASGTVYSLGNVIGSGIVVGVGTSTSISATNLLPGQSYDVYIYSYNSGATCAIAYNTVAPLTGTLATSNVGASTLINPYGDGGFENGTTLAANGWTVVNGGSGNNNWFVGSAATPYSGVRSAYIDNGTGATNTFTNTSATTVHFYRDITFPAGQTAINLSFKWKGQGEGNYDYVTVFIAPTTTTPTVNSPAGAFQSWLNFPTAYPGSAIYCSPPNLNLQANYQTQNICLPSSFAGTTKRVIFAWTNDGSAGTQPAGSVDEISLVTSTPAGPADQATALNLTTVSTSQINVSYTASVSLPAPAGYLVVRYPAGSVVTSPASGTNYIVGQSLGLGTVAYIGSATSFNSTGLSGNTSYDYYVYDYYTSTCPAGNVYNTNAPLMGTQITSPCGTLIGTIPVGPTAPASPAGFSNLTTALAYINTNGLGGATVLELQSDYVSTSETFPITFPSNACVSAVNPLTIRPASGVATPLVITTSNATAAIDLNGATYVTIDGQPGGTGGSSMLRIVNTLTTAISTVRMINDARNNTITYCDIQGASTTSANPTTSGVVFIGGTAGLFGNDNNTISNNSIHAVGTTLPTIGIGAYNVTTAGSLANNDNNTISNNNIYDFFSATLASTGIKVDAGNNNYSITNNKIYQASPRALTAAVAVRGIWLNPNSGSAAVTYASGHTVTGNYIGGNSEAGTGVMTYTSSSTSPFVGMDISVGNGTGTVVNNNTITNISFQSSSVATVTTGQFTAISINYGNVTNINNNIIGKTGTGITVLSAGATVATLVAGIRIGGGILANTISGNDIGNINANMTTNTVAHTVVGILLNGGTTSPTITNNNVGPLTSGTTSTTATGSAQVIGISTSVASVTPTITGNTIHDLSNFVVGSNTGATGVPVLGILLNNTSINTAANISNNTIYNLAEKGVSTSLTFAPYVQGIFLNTATTGITTLNANNIHSFSTPNWAPSGTTTGIPVFAAINTVTSSIVNITNNMIRLGIDGNGNSVTQPISIRAIYRQSLGGTYNIWNNSVYVGGSNVGACTAATQTAAFFRQGVNLAIDNVRNNIFVNNRTNATTGIKHYAVYLGATTTLALDYNVYNSPSSATNFFGFNGTADVASYTAGWITGDNNGQTADPQFVNATGDATSVDLHINTNVASSVEQTGVYISALANDYDGQARLGLTPSDIGADAGNFTPLNACSGTPASSVALLTDNSIICSTGTKTIYLSSYTVQPGITYQWQESSTGLAGSWTNVTTGTGANTNVYNTGTISATTYFQCLLTCTSSGLSTASYPAVASVPGLFPGGYYTIDKTLSTGGGNYASFAEAVNALSCGIAGPVTFDVASGTGPYTEQVNIPQILGTSATNTVTFLGNNEELTFNATLSTVPYTLSLNGADYFRFNNLRVTGTGATYALACHLWNNADNNIFTGCTFTVPANGTSTTQVPFSVSGSETSATTSGASGSNNKVDACTMVSGYYNTCFVGNSVGGGNLGNQLINSTIRDQYFYASYNLYQNGMIISGNTFERPTRTTLSTYYGVYLSTGCINMLVEKNKFRNTWGAVPSSTGTQYTIYNLVAGTSGNENKIYNNLISDINFNGTLYGIYGSGNNYCKMYHNTISFDQTAASGTTTTYGIYSSGSVGVEVRDNNITIARGGSGAKYAVYYTSATGVISNNNNLFVNSTAGTNCVGFYVSGFPTLTAWQGANASAWDQQSVSMDPVYAAPSLGFYKPTALAMDNLGVGVGITTDILGVSRSVTTPDLGAYEFAPPALDAGITWVAPVAPFTAGPQYVTVNISNSAINTITDITLSYTDGGTPVTETFTGLNITSSTSQTITFTLPYNITGNGTLQASIVSVNGGFDDNLLNNTTAVQNICLALAGGTYTINSTVPTGGGNYQTFNDAVTALNCGILGPVVFNVVAGTGPYNEQVNINPVVGTSATNTITFNGNANTLTYNATNSAAPHTFMLSGADYIRVNNLIMEGTNATYALVCHLWNQADNNMFTNCTFNAPANGTSSIQVPFSISGSNTSATTSGASGDNNIITGCTMFSGYYNTCLVGNTGLSNTGNQIINCNIRDQYFYGAYILYQNGAILSGNTFERTTRTTLSTYYGIYVGTGCTNLLVEKNKIRKTWDAVPTSTGTQYSIYNFVDAIPGNENRFYNNLISDINFNGTIYGMYMTGADYWKAYHNTISLDQTSASGTTTTYGIYSSGTTAYDVRNNNITIARGGTGAKYALYYTSPGVAISNYNNLFVNSSSGTNCTGFTTVGYPTLSNWQTTNLDLNSTSVDPFYNNPALADYHPTNVSLDNTGTNLGVTTDITGVTRNASTPDVGSYEFTVAPTDAGIFTFNSPGISGCYSTTQDVNVTVKNFGSLPINFSINPMTVTCIVTGAATATLTGSPSGILAPGATTTLTLGPTFDMSINGTYNFTVTSTTVGDGNATNDALSTTPTRTVGLVAGTISASQTNVCISSPPTLTLSGNYGANIQWQESTTGLAGSWTNVGTGGQTFVPTFPLTSSGNMYYQVVLTCNSNTATTNMLTLAVTVPQLGSTTPGSRCGFGSVNLGATALGGASINWYANATGGLPLGTGTSFATPNIATSTNFYAEAVSGAGALTGLGNTTFPTSSGFNAKRGIQFDAYQNFTLTSFDFPAAFAGTTTMTVELQNSAGTVLQTGTFSETNSNSTLAWHTVTLNWLIPAGTGYKLLCTFLTGSLSNYSHTTGVDYANPAFNNLGPVGIITNGLEFGPVVSTTTYYYFFNLAITAGCNSLRTPVMATVIAPPTVSIASTATTICEGQSTTLTASSPNDPNYTYTWNPGALSGSSVTVSPTTTTTYTLNAIDNTTGTYQTCANQLTQTIVVNPLPEPFTASASPATICSGSGTSLAASAPAVGTYCIPTYSTGTGSGDWCQSLVISGTTLNNVSGASATPYYTFYPTSGSTTATLTAGNTYTITVVGGTFSSNDFAAWIDYNKNGDFVANGEKLGEVDNVAAGPATATIVFTVPLSAYNGQTRFRLREADQGTTGGMDPCVGLTFGETEDYTITIVGGTNPYTYAWTPAANLTTPNNISTAATNLTSTTNYTVTASNSYGCTRTASALVTVNQPTTNSTAVTSPCNTPYTWAVSGQTYSVSGTYTFTSLNAQGCLHTETLNLTIAPCNTTLGLTCYIEGYWDGASAMLPVLNNQGQSNPTTDCDSITVELYNSLVTTPLPAPDYTTTAVLHTDGTASAVFTSAVSGNYYIVIKHRNALQTWSASAMPFPATTNYNFSSAATQAYGSNQVEVATGVWAMYSGDVAIDENMDLLDLGLVEADISNFLFGYLATDLNGDGNVDLLDSPVLEANISNFIFASHP